MHDFVSARFKGSLTDTWTCRWTVVLELPAREVLPYAGDGTVEALGERRCSLAAGSWSWGSLAASYGRFDVPMHVIGPPELAAAFATLAKRYAATGDTGHGSTSPSAAGHDGPVTTLRSAEVR